MTADNTSWRPGANLAVMQQRARMLQQLRAFFAQRDVLEVETPILQYHAVTDVHIDTLRVPLEGADGYLHSSPEYPMKRLLAAGSGPIYQVCRVFRADEAGHRHNPEFTMVEWYRPGFDHHRLMQEVDDLVRTLLTDSISPGKTLKLSYRELFDRYLQLDPFSCSVEALQRQARQRHIDIVSDEVMDRDGWLDLLLTHVIEPQLPANRPVFIYDYPASQGALARLQQQDDITVASRFELYLNGLELANGYHELLDPVEQRRRFERDQQQRQQQGRFIPEIDEKLLAALKHGLPDCAGVALGIDRLLMIATGCDDIRDVLSFSMERA
ncbi:EF-P lysine aminoacylase EpmA [Thiohalophilus thiocyanatoxydans]|uniref:Lysyl-tRNA synthetase class 2 n=1 Tax=Thiohalophilus thiocyanatoxydans TaxID=381308 RepID=A0A4R8IMA9_9GAMM|nr:EF-P lysine aminoacylase EpmA [Thiohalophilus thiocyanatoxydans]TDY01558.1 lysyl-tRNA synthetase class 2 [Thiohalophilus thiocyanatoxydans]